MNALRPLSILVLAAAAVPASPAAAQCDELWMTPWSGGAQFDSYRRMDFPIDVETADDFEAYEPVHRIVIWGTNCINCPEAVAGVTVRFYEWTADGPGALQDEQFLAAGDPGFYHDPADPDTLDVTLAKPFPANGQHFVVVQLVFETGGSWDVWGSNPGAPALSPVWFRDNIEGGGWTPYPTIPEIVANRDMNFRLCGAPVEPPDIPSNGCGEWVERDAPLPPDKTLYLTGIRVFDPADAWVVGEARPADDFDADFLPFAAHWDGQTWTETEIPCPAHPLDPVCSIGRIDGVATDDLWAVGSFKHPVEFDIETFVVHWDGNAWEWVPSPTQPNGDGARFLDVQAIGPDDVWAVGAWPGLFVAKAEPLAAHWDGSGWEVHFVPFELDDTRLWSVDAAGSDEVWAVGGDEFVLGGPRRLEIVRWDGSSWAYTEPRTDEAYTTAQDVVVISGDDVWVSARRWNPDDISGAIPVHLHWDGQGWTEYPAPGGLWLAAIDTDNVYAAGSNVISQWNGTEWFLVDEVPALPLDDIPDIYELVPVNDCEVWGVGKIGFGSSLQPLVMQILPDEPIVPGDVNGDGQVSVDDLLAVILGWGACPVPPETCPADLDGSGAVDVADLLAVILGWS